MKWFTNIRTLEELKREYKKLVLKHHPDVGGNEEEMKQINAVYDVLFERVKNIHEAADGKTYKKETNENASEYRSIIEALVRLAGIKIEIVGSWLWVTGNTYPNRSALRNLKFQFSKPKKAWYYHKEQYHKTSKKSFTLEELRNFYGSETVATNEEVRYAIG